MRLEDLFEMFTYEHKDITWDGDVASFELKGQKYTATVRSATTRELDTLIPFFGLDHGLKVGNIDFSATLPDGSTTQDLTGTIGSSVGKVIATVAQIGTQLKNKHKYDILLAIAKKQHSPTNYETRVHVYMRACEKIAKNVGLVDRELVSNQDFTVFAIFPYKLIDGMEKVKKHMDNVK